MRQVAATRKLLEAMAAGAPVIASDLDAFRRVLLDGKAGRLVPVDDSEALVVIASPSAVASHWVNEEILTYKRFGREHRIFALIVGGIATSPNERPVCSSSTLATCRDSHLPPCSLRAKMRPEAKSAKT